MGKGAHHRGSYQRKAEAVRAAAYSDPDTRCGRCGLTLADHPAGDRWTAGHVRDTDPTSPLRPEAGSCNYRAGAALTNGTAERQSRDWLAPGGGR